MVGCGLSEFGNIKDVPLVLYDVHGQEVLLQKTAKGFFGDDGHFLGGLEILRKTQNRPPQSLQIVTHETTKFHGLVTRDSTMLQAFQVIRNVAETDTTVLVRGESGSGKELVAKALHAESYRKNGPFLAVNCAALTPTLLESELFGHVKGAFTGAAKDRIGLFAQANHGTLFLDEVAELSLEVQAKLLRVLKLEKLCQ